MARRSRGGRELQDQLSIFLRTLSPYFFIFPLEITKKARMSGHRDSKKSDDDGGMCSADRLCPPSLEHNSHPDLTRVYFLASFTCFIEFFPSILAHIITHNADS
jgi:hypothetical protein